MQRMNWLFRIALFTLILCLGTGAALFVSETRGLALADLSSMSVSALTGTPPGDTLYAALDGDSQGIYHSGDGGQSWQRVSVGPNAEISALAVHPTYPEILFAGTASEAGRQGGSLWYSDDGGKSWDATRYALPLDENGQSPVISVLTIAPNQPNMVYMGTEGQGLYRFDIRVGHLELIGGQTLANRYVSALEYGPDGQMVAVTTEGLLKISKGKVVTEISSLPDGVVSLAIDPTDANILYAGTVGYGAHRSTDGGQTWQPLNNGLGLEPGVVLRVTDITVDSNNPDHLALATAFSIGSQLASDGIYESFDAGQNWTKIARPDHLVTQLTIKNGGIYAATSQGLSRYGTPLPAAPLSVSQRLNSLANPTQIQVAILAITVIFASWVLVARLSWVPASIRKQL